MPIYKVYAQLEPLRKSKGSGVVEFAPNISLVRTIEASGPREAFNLAKTIIPHPLVEPPVRPIFKEER